MTEVPKEEFAAGGLGIVCSRELENMCPALALTLRKLKYIIRKTEKKMSEGEKKEHFCMDLLMSRRHGGSRLRLKGRLVTKYLDQ